MSEFHYLPIDATAENARNMVHMTFLDLSHANHPNALRYANPGDTEHYSAQYEKLQKNPEKYLGAFNDDERLVGFAKFNEWNGADQIPFQPFIERAAFRLHINRQMEIPHHPLGVYALVSHPVFSGGEDAAIDMQRDLLDNVIQIADGREMRITHFENDSAKAATTSRGFFSTGQIGKVAGIKQTLFVRPESPTEEAA